MCTIHMFSILFKYKPKYIICVESEACTLYIVNII